MPAKIKERFAALSPNMRGAAWLIAGSICFTGVGVLIKLLGRGNEIGDQVEYRVKGKISLSEGFLRSIPFEDSGSFKLR